MRGAAAASLLLFLLASPLEAAPPSQALHVLFIGNSLTYVNDLPAMFRRIGVLDGRNIVTGMVAWPDYSLEDHLQSKKTLEALEREWDLVIMQQGPSSLDESRRLLIRDATVLSRTIRAHPRTRVALLTVWPGRSRWRVIGDVAEAYRLAAVAVRGELAPAGVAWAKALQKDPALPLFSSDAFHPSPDGTYLAALTAYRALVGIPPRRATTAAGARQVAGRSISVNDAQLAILVDAAEEAVLEVRAATAP